MWCWYISESLSRSYIGLFSYFLSPCFPESTIHCSIGTNIATTELFGQDVSWTPLSQNHIHIHIDIVLIPFSDLAKTHDIYIIYIYIWRYICDTPPPPGRSGGVTIYMYIYIYISPKKQTSLWNQAWLWLWHNTIGLSTWPKNPVGEIGLGTYWYSEQPVCKKSTWCRTSSSLSCYEYDHMCKGGSMPQPLERQVIYSQVCTTNGMYSRITHTWCMHLQR